MAGGNYEEMNQKDSSASALPEDRPAAFAVDADGAREDYRLQIEQASDAIIVAEMRGRIIDANRRACLGTGYTRDELRQMDARELFDPECLQAQPLRWDDVEVGGTLLSDRTICRKDGSTVPVELNVTRLSSGEVQVIARDISLRRDAQRRLRDSEQFLRSTIDALSAHIAVLDADGIVQATNRAWQKFAVANGMEDGEAGVGANYLAVCQAASGADRDDAVAAARGIRAVMSGASDSFTLEYPCHSPTKRRWFLMRASRFEHGDALRVVVAHEDITARRTAEEAERQVRTKYEALTELALTGVFAIQDDRFVYVNPRWSEITGFGRDELLAFPSAGELILEEDRRAIMALVREQIRGDVQDTRRTFRIQRADGRVAHIEAFGRPFQFDGRAAVFATAIDVTERVRAEEERRRLLSRIEHERVRLKDVFLHAPAFIGVLRGPDHVIDMVNPALYHLVGRRNVEGKAIGEALPELADQGFIDILDTVYRSNQPHVAKEAPISLHRGPGGAPEVRYASFVYQPLTGDDGLPSGIFVHGVDVTEEVESRDEARKAWRANEIFMDRSLDVICTVDRDGRFVQVSYACKRMWGYTPDEVVGRAYADFVHPDDLQRTKEATEIIQSGTVIPNFVNRYVRKDGTVMTQMWSAAWSEVDGLMYCVAHDVDELLRTQEERAAAEQALRASEARFARLVENGFDVITLLRPDGTVTYQSGSIGRVLGYEADELTGQNVIHLVHPDDRKRALDDIRRVVDGAPHIACELRFYSKTGRWRWLEISATNMLNDEAVGAIVLNSRDVTERRANQEALLKREDLLITAAHVAQLLNAAPDEGEGIRTALEIIGRSAEADRVYVFENHTGAGGELLTSQRFEWCRGGVEPQLENPGLQNCPVDDLLSGWADGLFFGEAVEAVPRLLSSEMREHLESQSIQSLLVVPIVVGNEWMGILGLDDCRGERAWSTEQKTVLSTIASIIGGSLQRRRFNEERTAHLAAVAASEARFRTLAEAMPDLAWTANPSGDIDYYNGREAGFIVARLRPDGSWDWRTSVHPADRARSEAAWEEAVRRGTTYEVEHRALQKRSGWRWCLTRAVPQKDADGNITKWYGTTTDIHDQKLAQEEMKRAKDEAEEMSRLKMTFLSNMSHEIRTPLTSILGFSDLLKETVEGEAGEMVQLINSSGERLMETLNSVLDLAQIEGGTIDMTPTKVDLPELVREMTTMFAQRIHEKGLVLALEVPDEPVMLSTDRGALGRVIGNLVSNAIKFTDEGTITVAVRRPPGLNVVDLIVTDTGVGISEEFLPSVFDEFRQESAGASRSYEGSGLGLTITKRLVELMRGQVIVESVKNRGSVFTVRLPFSAEEGAVAPVVPTPETPPRESTARVLVVEDNPEAQRLVWRVLRRHYDVTIAGTYDEALESARGQNFDLLLIDINLAEARTGSDLLQELRRLDGYADIPMLACTAFALPGDRDRFLDDGFDGYISKPFRTADLLGAVGTMLSRAPQTE